VGQDKVSVACPTYGRPQLLEEAIQGFLQQTYSPKEMIILNDLPGQELIFEHPDVRIINTNIRFSSFGEKMEYLFNHCDGDYIAWWGDDDINFSSRLTYGLEQLKKSKEDAYFSPARTFYSEKNEIKGIVGNGYLGGSLCKKESFKSLMPFPKVGTQLDSWTCAFFFKNGIKRISPEMKDEEVFYIYRWGTGAYHLSGFGVDKPNQKTAWERIGEMIAKNNNLSKVKLLPHWERDYVKDAKSFLLQI